MFRMPLAFLAVSSHCWFMVNFLSTRNPRSFSEKLLCRQSAFNVYYAWGCSSPGAGLRFPFVELCEVPVCQCPSERHHTHLVYQPLLPALYHLSTCWGCTLSHHLVLNEEVERVLGPASTPVVLHKGLVSSWTLYHWSQPFEPKSSASFQSTSVSIYPVCTFLVCLWGCSRRQRWNPC